MRVKKNYVHCKSVKVMNVHLCVGMYGAEKLFNTDLCDLHLTY